MALGIESADTLVIGAPEITSPIAETPGSMIGRYRLLEEIGEGGFGTVYMAEQREPVTRKVALKIIKLGMDTKQVIARFEAERQALALMDHPNIARVLDAGATESGRPFFVMELVRGIPITQFCDENKHSTRDRLDLFMEVCEAVQHAHQKGIIHRDLKPTNVLVTMDDDRPMPKVIDFGIAKATAQKLTDLTLFTQFNQFVGTPAYMSPEQAQMNNKDVDTRSDIYALGVILYELLTGKTPFDAADLLDRGHEAMLQAIREEDPPRPSTRLISATNEYRATAARLRQETLEKISTLLKGELDWVVMKALEKNRTRRYETANALREDVRRFLDDEPVEAVAPSASYALRKFAQKHKPAFAAAVSISIVVVAALGVSLLFYARERAQNQVAQENEQRAHKLRYGSDMKVVQSALQQSDTGLVKSILDRHVPESGSLDMRGWAWRYYYGQLLKATMYSEWTGTVEAIATSPDGRTIAATGLDGSNPGSRIVKLMDAGSLQVLHSYEGLKGFAAGLRFAADSSRIIVEGDGELVDIELKTDTRQARYQMGDPIESEVTTPEPEDSLASRDGQPRLLRLLPDGGGFVRLFKVKEDPRASRFRSFRLEHEPTVPGAKVSKQAGSIDSYTEIASSRTYLCPDEYTLAREVRLSPDGRMITIGEADRTIKILSVPELIELRVIELNSLLEAVAWSPDSKYLATTYRFPYEIDIWEVESGRHIGKLDGVQASPAADLCFSSDGSLLALAEAYNNIHIWEVNGLRRRLSFMGDSERTRSALVFTQDGKRLVTAGPAGLALWDTARPEVTDLERDSQVHELWNVEYSPDGSLLAATASDGVARLYHSESEVRIRSFPPLRSREGQRFAHSHARLRFSSDSRKLIVDNGDKTAVGAGEIGVYEIPSERLLHKLAHTGFVWDISTSPDGSTIATAGDTPEIIFWDVNTGIELFRINSKSETSHLVAFCPARGSRLVAYRSQMDRLTLRNLDNDIENSVQMPGMCWGLSFSPDGKVLAAGSFGAVSLYAVPSLQLLSPPIEGSRGPVPNVSFSPDGSLLAIPCWGGYVQLWNRKVNAEVGRLVEPGDWVISAKFSPDGKALAVSTWANGVRIYRAPGFEEIENLGGTRTRRGD